MRRIVMWNQVTADGYFAGPDGKLDWVVPDEEFDREVAEGIERARAGPGAILFGRRTYEQFEAFWPHVLDSPTGIENPHGGGPVSPAMRAMAVTLNEAPKLVFSRTRKEFTWQNSHLRREFDPHEIAALKEQPGNDIMVFGSGSIVSQLTQHELIDEYQFVVMPVLIGRIELAHRLVEEREGRPARGQAIPDRTDHASLRARPLGGPTGPVS